MQGAPDYVVVGVYSANSNSIFFSYPLSHLFSYPFSHLFSYPLSHLFSYPLSHLFSFDDSLLYHFPFSLSLSLSLHLPHKRVPAFAHFCLCLLVFEW